MKPRLLNRRTSVIIGMVFLAGMGGVTLAVTKRIQQPPNEAACNEAVPTGFRTLDEFFWDGPWAFTTGRVPALLAPLDNAFFQATNGPIRIRLDDGRDGALRVETGPCRTREECEPDDCGCPVEADSYWITVADSSHREVARIHLWAAYGRFQIVPVDLVDGPGDELLIVRVPAHSAPPIGYDLKIANLGATKPVELGGQDRVANLLGTSPIGCARWRTRLYIDREAPKPRPIVLRTEFAAAPCCRIVGESAKEIADMRRERILRFDAARRAYIAQ